MKKLVECVPNFSEGRDKDVIDSIVKSMQIVENVKVLDVDSGKDTNRTALNEMIAFVRNGDQVVVHSIDRLARDLRDLQTIILQLNEKGVGIEFLSERLVFSGNNDDAFAKLQLQLMGAFAEFERNIIRKRQAEGIAKAKAKGVYDNQPFTSKLFTFYIYIYSIFYITNVIQTKYD